MKIEGKISVEHSYGELSINVEDQVTKNGLKYTHKTNLLSLLESLNGKKIAIEITEVK